MKPVLALLSRCCARSCCCRWFSRQSLRRMLCVLAASALLMGGGNTVAEPSLGVTNGKFAGCPASPNCVSSDAPQGDHWIDPLRLRVDPATAWRKLEVALTTLPRITVVTRADGYLHVEARSLVFRFVDDVEFHLRPAEGEIAVRSASRVGYSDLGVNRRRVENLREVLRRDGVVE